MKLHHINLRCCDVLKAKKRLIENYSFTEYGYIQPQCNKLSKNVDDEKTYVLQHNSIYLTLQKVLPDLEVDTFDDIAICVDSFEEFFKDAKQLDTDIIQQLQCQDCNLFNEEYDKCSNCLLKNGLTCLKSIETTVIQSSIGNIKHTLLCKNNFNGVFLPGFIQTNFESKIESSFINNVDHIAFAVKSGESLKHMAWYQNCLHMSHLKTCAQKTKKGLVIRRKNGNGLRMFTLLEHPCSDNSLVGSNVEEFEMINGKLKFVFCESLSDEGSDQIQTFLCNHKGAGVQHIAFGTSSIIKDTERWQQNGVDFIAPPKDYYIQITKTLKELEEKYSTNTIKKYGILIDAEKKETSNKTNGYLFQVFTRTVFESKTFFFELIQRDNATGFGEGNVTALWNALDAHLMGRDIDTDVTSGL